MKTHKEKKEKLTKVYNLAVSTTFENEAETAKLKLHLLCKKYSLRLKDFVLHSILDIDYSVQLKTDAKRASRRSLIIKYVTDNTFTTAALAQLLADKYNYSDLKANKKAVAGTLYDMSRNKNWQVIRHENNTIEIVV